MLFNVNNKEVLVILTPQHGLSAEESETIFNDSR